MPSAEVPEPLDDRRPAAARDVQRNTAGSPARISAGSTEVGRRRRPGKGLGRRAAGRSCSPRTVQSVNSRAVYWPAARVTAASPLPVIAQRRNVERVDVPAAQAGPRSRRCCGRRSPRRPSRGSCRWCGSRGRCPWGTGPAGRRGPCSRTCSGRSSGGRCRRVSPWKLGAPLHAVADRVVAPVDVVLRRPCWKPTGRCCAAASRRCR